MQLRAINKQIPFLILVALLIAWWCNHSSSTRAQGPAMSNVGPSASTTWRPNRADAKYVGSAACVKCHPHEAASQRATAMNTALQPASTSEVLRSNQQLSFRSGPYSYAIARRGDQSIYTVTNGTDTISEPIAYAFGQGKAGQTYVFQHDGSFYESRVSFYRDINALDWTMGYPREVPPSLDVAAGRRMSADESRNCFSCHSTAATNGLELRLDRLIPGVSCEACHGPAGDHVALRQAKKLEDKSIFNPGRMSPDELSQDFCGSCHRSAEQVTANKMLRGILSVRFQPYRIFTSKGHDPADTRLSCIACHNPHENPKRDQAFYDQICFGCHRSAESLKLESLAKTEIDDGRSAKACKVGARDCASCHMPKVEIPGSHFQFTDHRIRIARPGEPFPN